MTSISPWWGQWAASLSQTAGQVPQPYGVCLTSKRNRPDCQDFLLLMRAEWPPKGPWSSGEGETLSQAVEEVEPVRLRFWASMGLS